MNLMNAYNNWKQRHLNRVSFWLHMAGIPACFIVAPVLLIVQQWWWALGFFVGGYVVQFVGHWIEGNQSGEEMLVRRLLGRRGKN